MSKAEVEQWLRKNRSFPPVPIRPLFEKAFRRAQPRRGKSRDPLLYSMIKSDAQTLFTLQDRNLRTLNAELRAVNDTFLGLRDNIGETEGNDVYPFFIRAYSFWRSALRCWATVRLPETYCLLRAAIENSAYGVRLFGADVDLYQQYFDRHHNRNAHRRTFTWAGALGATGDLQGLVEDLYGVTIDFGAHPNPGAVYSGVVELPNGAGSIILYQGARTEDLEDAGDFVVSVGIAILLLFHRCYEESYSSSQTTKRLNALLERVSRRLAAANNAGEMVEATSVADD